jgi:hypothetical protein
MRTQWILAAILALGAFAAQGAAPQQPKPPETRPLTKTGQMAFRTVAQELQQALTDGNELVAEECKAQSLSPCSDWTLDYRTGSLVRVAPQPEASLAPVKPQVKK